VAEVCTNVKVDKGRMTAPSPQQQKTVFAMLVMSVRLIEKNCMRIRCSAIGFKVQSEEKIFVYRYESAFLSPLRKNLVHNSIVAKNPVSLSSNTALLPEAPGCRTSPGNDIQYKYREGEC
jgi:hypothetical protein